jgi:hypothetical protein
MIKSIIYKEWIKVRVTFAALFLLNVLVVLSISISTSNKFNFFDAATIYSKAIFYQDLFFIDLMFIPFITGLILGIIQYFPEMNSNRLKLALHLPMNESKTLLSIQFFGLFLLFLIYLIDTLAIATVGGIYFSSEIINGFLLVSLPWYLAGFSVYIMISVIFIEPLWSRRILLMIVSAGFINNMFSGIIFVNAIELFSLSLPYFIVLTFILSPLILLSGSNYKRGTK